MNLLCAVFGHSPPTYAASGWYSPGQEYARVRVGKTDGIGRVHAEVIGACARCGRDFRVARVHLPHKEPTP